MVWVGVAREMVRERLAAWCLAVYAVTVIFWPWPPWRFLVPVSPLLLVHLWTALRSVHTRVRVCPPKRAMRVLAGAACVLALAANITAVAGARSASHAAGYPLLGPIDTPFTWQSFEALFAWLRERPDRQAVVAGALDTMLSLYTGHPAIRPFPHRPDALFYGGRRPAVGTARELADLLRGRQVRYLVDTPLYLFSEAVPFAAVLDELQRIYPGMLTEAYRGSDRRFVVYDVRP
jgi:hypothetical protein